MNIRLSTYFILIFLLALLQDGFAQNNDIDRILSSSVFANHFTESFPNEKVYLHMDNSSYFLGETLWFKAYVVKSDSIKLTNASEILHVELLTPEGAVIRSQKYRLQSGQCHGYINLDSALYSGYFELRAYTMAMLNFDKQNYFSRVFPIFEKPKNKNDVKEGLRTLPRFRTVGYPYQDLNERILPKKKNTSILSIEFYPEGGNLVQNLKSNIAFQIKDRYGETIDTMCYLFTNYNRLLDSVASTHLGMGCFELNPLRGNKYYLMVKGDENNIKYYLPDAFKKGITLSVDNLSDSINLRVRIESTHIADTLGIVILSRGRASSLSVFSPNMSDTIHTFNFKKSNLREGVNQVVIYNGNGKELASRMFFLQSPKNKIQLNLKVRSAALTDSLQAYARQELLLELKDSNNVGIETNFSVSIYDSTAHIPTFYTDNIYTNLLLSSELKGFVPNIHYYFESNDLIKKKNLDLLMLVYGWSRCKWEYLCGYKNFDIKYYWEKNLVFYGREYSHKWLFHNPYLYTFNEADKPPEGYYFFQPTDSIRMLIDTNRIRLMRIVYDSIVINKNKKADIYNDENIPYFLINKNRLGHYIMNFEDFYGECKLFISIDRGLSLTHDKRYDVYYAVNITDSEYCPYERPYDFWETTYRDKYTLLPYTFMDGTYIRQHLLDEAPVAHINDLCFHPSIKTYYYNKGYYNQLYPMFHVPILERANNRPFNSIEDYKKSYYVKRKYLEGGALWSIDLQLYSPNEYIKYYKLPLGTITYIANVTVDTSSQGNTSRFIIPIRQNYPEIREFKLDTSKYTYFIDSTIIHTSYDKREYIHNKFKDYNNYKIYEIKNLLQNPDKTSSNERPTYVIEHYIRIVKSKSFKLTREYLYKKNWTANVGRNTDIPKDNSLVALPWHASTERSKRIILFQGLTRVEKEFYSPDYSKEPLPKQGDYRRTLYWNPNVQTDSLGRAKVVFYNNSTCKSYIIDAQGLTIDGKIITNH